MKRAAVLVSALALVVYAVGLSAQAKPNFAGKWTMQADPNAAPPATPPAGGGGGGGGRGGGRGAFAGMEMTITQDANTVTVERAMGQAGNAKFTYKLDGSESKNMAPGRGGEMAEQVAKAMWDGAKLKVTTTGANGDTVQVLSMDGANLKVETTAPARGGGAPTTTSATYKKG